MSATFGVWGWCCAGVREWLLEHADASTGPSIGSTTTRDLDGVISETVEIPRFARDDRCVDESARTQVIQGLELRRSLPVLLISYTEVAN